MMRRRSRRLVMRDDDYDHDGYITCLIYARCSRRCCYGALVLLAARAIVTETGVDIIMRAADASRH